jgi:hypothetical protein
MKAHFRLYYGSSALLRLINTYLKRALREPEESPNREPEESSNRGSLLRLINTYLPPDALWQPLQQQLLVLLLLHSCTNSLTNSLPPSSRHLSASSCRRPEKVFSQPALRLY